MTAEKPQAARGSGPSPCGLAAPPPAVFSKRTELRNYFFLAPRTESLSAFAAVNLNLVAFSRLWGLHGQIFSIFVITDAAAEAAVGLGILIAFFRNKETVNVDEVDLLKW